MTGERTIKTTRRVFTIISLVLLGLGLARSVGAAVLVPRGTSWKYLDDGSNQGTGWRNADFNDSIWAVGRAQLGYGDNDEATRISYGGNSTNKFVTTYFRRAFNVENPSVYRDVALSLLRDDGAVVYVNGREVFRSNMPGGTIGYRTLASGSVGGADESAFISGTFFATNLVNGANVLAVEVHQSATNSSDVSFDLELVANHPPVRISRLSPLEGASSVNFSANLSIALADVCTTNTVTIYGRVAGPPPGPDFTIVALPDTQYYVSRKNGGQPEMFVAQADWIVANKAGANIAFVTQLGDCVENGDNNGDPIEWLHATNAMYRLEDPVTTLAAHGIPYGIAVGNHDQSAAGNPAGATRFYNEYFGETHFTGRNYYGGHHGTNNDNHFEMFSASGLDFIVIHLEYDPAQDTNVLNWVSGLLETYRERRAILVSHYIITIGGSFGAQGQKLYQGLKGNPNLFLMLCGHDPGESRRTDTFNGNVIHSVMSDYQGRTNGGSGFLRLMEFSPSNNVIRVKTYSPTFGEFETDANSQFTLDYDMSRGGGFTALGIFTGICSATNLAAAWADLSANTTYNWFVEVSDGAVTSRSAMWQFNTGSAVSSAPIKLSLVRDPGGNLVLSWPTVPGSVYQLVYRDSLTAGSWANFTEEITAATSALAWTMPIDPSIPHRFFAVKMVR